MSIAQDVMTNLLGFALDQLRIDPDNQFIGGLLSKLQLVHSKELKELSALGASLCRAVPH
jgi:hypothetical protein